MVEVMVEVVMVVVEVGGGGDKCGECRSGGYVEGGVGKEVRR